MSRRARVQGQDASARLPRSGWRRPDRDTRSERRRRIRLRPLAPERLEVAVGIDVRIEDAGELLDEILGTDELHAARADSLNAEVVARLDISSRHERGTGGEAAWPHVG